MASIAPAISLADLEGLSPATIEQLLKLMDRRNDSLSIAFYRKFGRSVSHSGSVDV